MGPATRVEPEIQDSLRIRRLRESVESVVRGKADAIRLACVCLIARGHLLIEDVPGVGKTTLASALAASLGCGFRRVQFTSDLMPSDIVGVAVFDPAEGSFSFRPGPLFTHVVLADEINRSSPRTQSALLEAMSEGRVSVDSQTHPLPEPFFVIATQNPLEHHGTYPLPDSQLDRFLMRIHLGYPDPAAEREIVAGFGLARRAEDLTPVMTTHELLSLQRRALEVTLNPALVDYIVAIIGATRTAPSVAIGASPRAAASLGIAARATALMEGRDYVIPDDVKVLAAPVLAHRLVLRSSGSGGSGGQGGAALVVEEILQSVEVAL